MGKFKLYPDQQEVVDKCIAHINKPKNKPAVCVCPTSFGKSLVISELARVSGMKVLLLSPSIELLKQNYEKLLLLGGEASIYSAGANSKEMGSLTYATLGSVKNLGKDFKKLGVDLVIIDECDRGVPPAKSSMFSKFIKDLQPKSIIGFTATPFYNKSGGFGEGTSLRIMTRVRPRIFSEIIHVTQIKELIDAKRWTPVKYVGYEFDENALVINSSGSDFTEESIREYNKVKGINNKIFLEVKGLVEKGYTKILVFCDSVESAETFSKHTPNSNFIHGGMNKKDREDSLNSFKKGNVSVMYNYSVLSIGYDHPELQVVIMGRATGSFSMYSQILGRLVRIHLSKKEALFLDWGGNVKRFGELGDVTIEDHETNGWSLFSGDRLISGYTLGGVQITRQDLEQASNISEKITSDFIFEFGKWKGYPLHKIERSYLEWLCSDKFEAKTPNMRQTIKVCKNYLNESKLEMLS